MYSLKLSKNTSKVFIMFNILRHEICPGDKRNIDKELIRIKNLMLILN